MNLSTSARQFSMLAALGLLAACGGETTLDEVAPETGTPTVSCDADGGVCDEGDVRVRPDLDIVEVDCCELETDVEESLCEALYTNTLPDGLAVVDTCDEPRSAGSDEDEDEDEEPSSSDEDPCEGLTGFQQIVCGFGGAAETPDEEEPTNDALGDILGGLLGGGDGGVDLLGVLLGGGGDGGFDLGSLLGGGGDTGGFDWGSLFGGGDTGGDAAAGFDWGSLFGGGAGRGE